MTAGEHATDPSARHRLPYDVSPRRYELRLAPDVDAGTFDGEVRIEAHAGRPVQRIVLHALDLTVTAARVVTSGSEALDAETAPDPDHADRLVLELPQPVEAGDLRIDVSFRGSFSEQLCGLYRSTWVDAAGHSRALALTQFEATDARRAFPCFDEPDRKASFAVTVDVPAGMEAVSNGPEVSRQDLGGGRTRVRFAETIPMSTYLVALVVGPLECSEPVDVDGVPVRVVHVPGRAGLTSFALEVAAHALRYYAEWFGLPYPGEKLDLVAVPDFAFGAMENLGCVVFRETTLLVDPGRSSRLELERVADVVSHEIAHMWFGDLVTMKWWNGIWLNEAFATLMELFGVDHFRADWERWVSFGSERDAAMATDALHATRPVEYPVGPPEEAQGMFDVLTYQKGGGVLRMLERYLGEDRFRAGIRRYLADHRLSNTDTADLWDAIEAATGEPVRRIMDSWILHGGFPLVSASRRGDEVTLHQEPFSYTAADGESAIGHRWSVPVLLRSLDGAGTTASRVLLEQETVTVPAPGPGATVVNAGGSGFYRVRYDDDSRRRLLGALDQLDTLERYNLVSDTWAAVVAGRVGLDGFLEVAEALRGEDQPELWRPVTGALGFFDHVVGDVDRPVVAGYARALLADTAEALGWERRPGDPERIATLRADLLRALGTVGADPEVRRTAMARHAAFLAGDDAALDPDLAPAVAAVVARAGGPAEFDAFLARHRSPATPQEGVRYLMALAGFEDPALGERAYAIATTEARTQDGPFLLQLLLSSRVHGPATWARLAADWESLVGRFPPNVFTRMLEGVKLLCRDPGLVEEVARFVAAHPVPTGQRTVEQSLERQGVNLALAGRLEDALVPALSAGADRLARGARPA